MKSRTPATLTNVTGSSGCTPKRNDEIACARRAAATVPIAGADADHPCRTAKNQTEHGSGARAKRDAYAELTHPLLYRVGDDAEHANQCQHQCQASECHHQPRPESLPGCPLDCNVVERHQRPDCHELLLVYARDRTSDRRRQRRGGTGLGAHEQEDVVERVLRERNIELDELLGLVGSPLYLTCYAHDLSNLEQACRRLNGNTLADR